MQKENVILPATCLYQLLQGYMHSLWVGPEVLGPDAGGLLKVKFLCRLYLPSVYRDVELTHLARHDGILNLTKCTNITVCGMHLQGGVEYVCMCVGGICGCGWSMWVRGVYEYG